MKKIALVVAVSLALAACHDNTADIARAQAAQAAAVAPAAVPGQPQTVVVQQPAQQSSTGDLLTGAALGAMAMHMFSGSSRSSTPAPSSTHTIERRTVIKEVERPAAKPATPTVAAAAPTPAPAKAPAGYGSSFSKPSAPTYGSSFSKPSSGSSFSSSRSSGSSFGSSRSSSSSFGGRR
ncbi:hypothetical protein [Herbaspirillum huttiense]|uniref:Lipoprotein n=1 Tax=Herbaspirillum huttiense subsp. lycopersici TaxID=3074428 RepID=A0ABU2EG43_9BURK|nr:hypothetical protein [Herbaspirillum huttiense]MDR9847104.1 hypothetical protein [Herbaspirillum huttiense SE1]